MTTFRRLASVMATNLVVLLLLLELAGIAFYAVTSGGVFYLRAPAWREDKPVASPFSGADYHPVLHPYFGFAIVDRPGAALRQGYYLNNHHFLQEIGHVRRHPGCCDYPVLARAPDEVLIGIFGGSVAIGVAIEAQMEEQLAGMLEKTPRYRGKRIRVLNFASGGYKQPQQLQILTYYLSVGQKFDAVINVDGFNELLWGTNNAERGVAVDWPNPDQWLRLAQYLDQQAARPDPDSLMAAYHEAMARIWRSRGQTCSFAACYLLAQLAEAWHRSGSSATIPAAPADPLRLNHFAVHRAAPGDPFALAAEQWATSVRLMHQLLATQATPFLSIVQPNQWYRSAKPFEARSPNALTRTISSKVPPGYRALLARIPALRASGVSVHDETALFDRYGMEFYSDDCCHFTPKGNRMLVESIADWLATL